MLRALSEFRIEGLTTLIPFHRALLASDQWARAETCRDLMEDADWLKSTAPAEVAAPPAESDGAGELVTRD
jgi:acetyl-CoA/propionyl-CoA carboxylase biotin carboxyl carrier protein